MLFVMHIQLSYSREFFVTVIANKILNTKMLFEMSCIVTWFFITVRAILTQIEIVIMNTHMTVSWVSTRHKKKNTRARVKIRVKPQTIQQRLSLKT